MGYAVKELFYTLQGEGQRSGRASVFCRFAGCNMWSGREDDRATSICYFCDTDFVGIDGVGGARFESAEELARAIHSCWKVPTASATGPEKPYVVFTGGEPALQLDHSLIEATHACGFEIAIETNGTLPVPDEVDWITVSPKDISRLVQRTGSELKLLFPFQIKPEDVSTLSFSHYFISPINTSDASANAKNLQDAIAYCFANPQWRLSMQQHKYWQIP